MRYPKYVRSAAFTLIAILFLFVVSHDTRLDASLKQSPSSITWVTFQDPNEQVFTLDVPKGWHVIGGAFRMGYSDVRVMVDMTSPDGTTQIRVGDVAIPTYALPTPTHPPGDIVDLGAQAQMRSARYHTGQQFATIYAETHFIRVCNRLEPLPAKLQPPLPDDQADSAGALQSTAGQAEYSCDSAQGKRVAYVYARTNLQTNLWVVKTLLSYLAPSENEESAREILRHSARSFQLSPAWMEKQKQEDAYGLEYQRARQQQRIYALGQQVAQFEQQMSAMRNQVAAFERGQQRQADQVRSFTNALNGITPTIDPFGNERDVWTGPYANYWRNGQGTIVNSTDPPGAGWTQLKPEQ